jgi:uncharacterized membrane protein (UPF0136 family)
VRALAARIPRPSLAIAACAVVALAVVLTPWFALDDYVPNGWDATWWARAAAIAALLAIVALRLERRRIAALLILAALACVVVRVIAPPDFGFGFDGLDVPTERRWGIWVALVAAVVALVASAARLRAARPAATDRT